MTFNKGKILWAIVFSILSLSACKSLKNTNTLFQSEYDKFADTAKSVYVVNDHNSANELYKIKPYDLIAVRNLQNPEGLANTVSNVGSLSATLFKSDREGTVNFPALGLVNLNGLTQEEARIKIQELYGKTLLKNPIIELTIVDNKVTLLGEAIKPGNYQLEKDGLDLIDLLGISGGLAPYADPKKIKIIRGDRKSPEIIFVNLKNIKSLSSDKLKLKKNDIIYIAPKGLYSTTENVKNISGLIQPAFLILNSILLVYTIGKQ